MIYCAPPADPTGRGSRDQQTPSAIFERNGGQLRLAQAYAFPKPPNNPPTESISLTTAHLIISPSRAKRGVDVAGCSVCVVNIDDVDFDWDLSRC